jgi:hypothetical protein
MGTKVYFFADGRYLQFDRGENAVDAEFRAPVRRIATDSGGMSAAGFGGGVDAALNWGNGQAFFFKDDSYVRYTIANGRVDDGYPLKIGDHWPGMAEAGFLGCAVTAIAISLGAPFWFDTLQKAVNIRSTGPKPSKSSSQTNGRAASSG